MPTTSTQESFNAGPPVMASAVTTVTLPEPFQLPNSLRVLLLRDAGTSTVSLGAEMCAGREFDTDSTAGLDDLVTGNPVGNPWQVFASAQSLTGLTQSDLLAFYRSHYRPDTTVLTLVGDFDPAAVKALLTRKFGS